MIHKIADKNGILIIKDKLLEELEELKEAIEHNDERNIIEEIADVIIVAEQYIYKSDMESQYKKERAYKIDRTVRRLGI